MYPWQHQSAHPERYSGSTVSPSIKHSLAKPVVPQVLYKLNKASPTPLGRMSLLIFALLFLSEGSEGFPPRKQLQILSGILFSAGTGQIFTPCTRMPGNTPSRSPETQRLAGWIHTHS